MVIFEGAGKFLPIFTSKDKVAALEMSWHMNTGFYESYVNIIVQHAHGDEEDVNAEEAAPEKKGPGRPKRKQFF